MKTMNSNITTSEDVNTNENVNTIENINTGKITTMKEIEAEVTEVRNALGLDKMPSTADILEVTGKYTLVSAISAHGGFMKVANALGLMSKRSNRKFNWTNDIIEKGIKECMLKLGIRRMPSRTEVLSVTKDTALCNQISKTKGYYGWADYLNIKIKESRTKMALEAEHKVAELIEEYVGLDAHVTKSYAPYDILVDGKVKVEVKYSKGYADAFFSANLYNGLQKADVLVFVCENDEIGSRILVIPSHHLQGTTQLSIGKKSKYDKYKDNWEIISQFNYFMDAV